MKDRSVVVTVLCSTEEHNILMEVARREDMPVSQLIRIAVGLEDMPKRKRIPGMIY